ncbi:MAG: hypothetical protein GXX94_11275 [Chloroflexi bacterium]|nr:hypothetical protein [Chloroflexota bacterium]
MLIDLDPAAIRAATAGGLFLIAWALGIWTPVAITRLLARRDTPFARRMLASPGWRYLGRIAALALSLGALYIALTEGYLDAYVTGLWLPRWQELSAWLPAVSGISALWSALLWGIYWGRIPYREDHSPWHAYGTPLGTPAHVLHLEVQASILRGALIPFLGVYWGPWAAAGIRAAMALLNPAVRRGLGHSQERAFLYLDLGADAMAAGCFVVSGNMWASLIARGCVHLGAGIVHRILLWRGRRASRLPARIA